MRYLFILSILACSSVYGQQRDLLGNKGGKWIIYSDTDPVELPNSYYQVSNFDNRHLTSFAEKGKFGIINSSGRVICEPRYNAIKQLGGGIYLCIDSNGQFIIDFTSINPSGVLCNKANKLTKHWQFVETKTERYLLNTESGKHIDFLDSVTLISYGFDHVYLKTPDGEILYGPDGDSIQSLKNNPLFNKNQLDYTAGEQRLIIFETHQIILPADAANVRIVEDELFYSFAGRSYILNTLDGKEIMAVDYDKISHFGGDKFLVTKDGKTGIIRRDGSVICSPKYSFITDCNTHYNVRTSGGLGVMTLSGVEIVPCQFKSISSSPDFFIVQSDLDLTGVFSKIRNKLLVECVYERIKISDNKIRAWSNGMLRIFQLDEKHNIVHTLTVENAITLKTRTTRDLKEKIDERLYSIGWFTESVPRFDTMGFKVGETHRWGLKGINDTVLIEPRLSQPLFIPKAEFSLVPQIKLKTTYAGVQLELNAYSAVNFFSGKALLNEAIFSVDTMDLYTRSYIRFMGLKGPGIIRDNGEIVRVDYMDGDDNNNVRFCKAKQCVMQPLSETDPRGVSLPNIDLNDDPSVTMDYQVGNVKFKQVLFEDTEWNYFDLSGKPMFEKSFDFAQEFYRKTAIVQQDGRWGVVNKDSLIIPARYSSIKRTEDFSDTLFVAGSTPVGIRYLDTLTHELPFIARFMKTSGSVSQVQVGSAKQIIDSDYAIISGESSAQKWIGEGYFFVRENKECIVFDAEGTQVCTLRGKPDNVLFDRYVLADVNHRFGLLNFSGDTILPFAYKFIRNLGPYILAGNGFETTLYNAEMNVVKKLDTDNILVDSQSKNIAILQNGKCTVIDQQGKVLKKFSNFTPLIFHGGVLIAKGSGAVIRQLEGDNVEIAYTIKNVEVMDDYGFLIEDRSKNFYVYTASLNRLRSEDTLTRARYLGEGFVLASRNKETHIFSESSEWTSEKRSNVRGSFNSGYLLVSDNFGGKYRFLNMQLENSFGRTFNEALPFENGYAAIRETSGWTIIDRRGYPKSMPSFDAIKPLGNNLFSTNKQMVYGVFDSHGKMLIPVEFQQIHFLEDDLIQGVREGELFYFHRDGSPIELTD